MTRTAGHAVRVESAPATARRLEIVWDLSRVAGAELGARLGIPCDRDAVGGVSVWIASRGDRDRNAAGGIDLVHASGARSGVRRLESVRTEWACDEEARLDHVEAGAVLTATLRRDAKGGVRAIYTRSPILGALGVGGGRYSVRSVRVETGED